MADPRPKVWVSQPLFDDVVEQLGQHFDLTMTGDVTRYTPQRLAEQLAGVALHHGGLYYPDAGWAHPPALCRWLIAHPAIELRRQRQPVELRRVDGGWQALQGGQVVAEAPVVVLAGAADAARFDQSGWLPLKRIRGQITCLPTTAASVALRTVLCAKGYVAPARDGQHTLGASFNFKGTDTALSVEEHQANLELLEGISHDLTERLQVAAQPPEQLQGRAAFRCTNPDYLPLIGPLADQERFLETYASLTRNARQVPDAPCPWLDGLYVNTAHGSRGMISTLLSGELIAAWLEDEPLPLPRDVAEACHPNRFLVRRLVRGEG